MSVPSCSSGSSTLWIAVGLEGRQIALQIDHARKAPLRIDPAERLKDTIGARGQVGIGQHALTPVRRNRLGDRRLGARHHHRADGGLAGAAPDVDDHRHAADLGERLVGQPGGTQARRDQHHGGLVRHRLDDHRQIGEACSRARTSCAGVGWRPLGQIAASSWCTASLW